MPPPEAPAQHAPPKPLVVFEPSLLRKNVPEALRSLPQWVVWLYVRRKGKWSKCPINPTKGGNASSTDPATWDTFENAIAACRRCSDLAGVGFVFGETDPFIGIDIDGCCKSEGVLDAGTYELIKPLRTYGEWSPSRLGIHLILNGKKPGSRCRNHNVEVYDQGRFFCMTGDRLPFAPTTVNDCGEAMRDFYRAVFGEPATAPDGNGKAEHAVNVTLNPCAVVPADKLLLFLDNDPKFKAIWERKRPDLKDRRYGQPASASAYDLALANWGVANGLSDRDIAALIHHWRVKHDEDPAKGLRPDYINRTIARARVRRNRSFGLTDLGNAERFVRDHCDDVRYCATFGKWLLWNGKCWAEDTTLGVYRLARQALRSIYREAADCEEEKRRKAIAAHAKASESEHRINAMVSLARSDATVAVTPDAFDTNPYAFNCENGTINLRTGELREHCRDDLLTKVAPVEYHAVARSPLWEKFLHRIFDGNAALARYMQRLCGVALTADTSEQALWVLWGGGANGKSTLVDTLCGMMGDYASTAPAELLTVKRNEEHPTEIADLHGRRLVVACESEEGKRLRCEFVKRCTGDAKLKARRMRTDYFEFSRTHSTWLITNNLPRVADDNVAMWRRIKLIPFTVTIPEADQDKRLVEKLKKERASILRWAVEGCLDWLKNGLGDPDEVRNATADYRQEQDRLADFIAECLAVVPGAKVSRNAVCKAYAEWCEKAGERWPVSSKVLYGRLRQTGAVDTEFTEHGRTVRGFTGLGLHG